MSICEEGDLDPRMARIEEKLQILEHRIDLLEHKRTHVRAAPEQLREPVDEPLVDFALIARSVLIVGGAYLLRALTELHVLPELAGMLLAFFYALSWMVIADRALGRGRRSIAYFDAATGALIASGLIWEATTKFHAITVIPAAVVTLFVAVGYLAVSVHRESNALAWIGSVMAVMTLTGLAVGTGDLLGPALVASLLGVTAVQLRRDVYVTSILAVAGSFLALVLVVMTALGHTPHSSLSVEAVLLAIAVAWLPCRDWRAGMATLVGIGGASALALEPVGVAILWAGAAVLAAWISRKIPVLGHFVPLWAIGALVATFVAGMHGTTFLITAGICVLALALMPSESVGERTAILAVVAIAILAAIQSAFDLTAMLRSLILAMTTIALALYGRREAAILARVALLVGGVKLLVEDIRGSASAMVVALVAYGLAMLVVAKARRPARSASTAAASSPH